MNDSEAREVAVISDIVLQKELGHGWFGTVHLAILPPHGTVAAKIIDCAETSARVGLTEWAELKEHIFAEANQLKKAESLHVVRVHGAHYDDKRNSIYIITEICDGSLGGRIESGPLPLADAHRLIRHTLIGLEAMHLRGMVHRDIKPNNILVKEGVGKLADFGLVSDRIVDSYASSGGYNDHLAPEVFAASRTSKRTDVWAMGMTIFRLLNGDPWYHEFRAGMGIDNELDPSRQGRLEELVMSGKLSSLLRWMPHVPAAWRRFVNKALHINQQRRYQDGGEMLSAISTLGLPDSPSWTCEHSDERIVWRRLKEQREQVVVWDRAHARRNSYEAYSQRPADGAARSVLVKNSGPLPQRAAADGLYEVFRTRIR